MLRLAKVPRQLNGRGRMPSKPFPVCHSASLPGLLRLSCLFPPRGPLGHVHVACVHLALDSQRSGCVLREKGEGSQGYVPSGLVGCLLD